MKSLNNFQMMDAFNCCNGKTASLEVSGDFLVYGSNGVIGKAKESNYERAIIVGRVGAYCGSIEFSEKPFCATDNTIVLVPKDDHNLKYWYYRLKIANLGNYSGGAAQLLLTQST